MVGRSGDMSLYDLTEAAAWGREGGGFLLCSDRRGGGFGCSLLVNVVFLCPACTLVREGMFRSYAAAPFRVPL